MTRPAGRAFAASLLLLLGAAGASGQFPERSAFDEHDAPVTLRGLKDVRVSAGVQVYMAEAKSEVMKLDLFQPVMVSASKVRHGRDLVDGLDVDRHQRRAAGSHPGEHRLDRLRVHQGVSARQRQVGSEGRRVLRLAQP